MYGEENKAGHVSELHWNPSQTTAPNDSRLLTLIVKSLVVERDGTKQDEVKDGPLNLEGIKTKQKSCILSLNNLLGLSPKLALGRKTLTNMQK